jgi:RNA polymerase sigma-70 factor (ECF subfamily)
MASHRPEEPVAGPDPADLSERLEDRRDQDLHRLVLGGDRRAFDELYRRYASIAYGLALRVTGRAVLAQDVVHDAFLAIWRAPEAFDPARGAFRTFFLSLVHHRAVDTVRREERLRRRQARMNPEPLEDEDVAEDVVREAWFADRRERVVSAMRHLSPEQRQVLELAYYDGYTQARIAQELDLPLGTVKTRTLAAMRRMRALMGRSRDDL